MLTLNNVSVEYLQNKQSFWALKDIDLNVKTGQCLAVVGKSGCGKTTLLNVMAGLKRPTKGEVSYRGSIMNKPTSEVSMIFQNHGLFQWKNIRENIILPIKLKKQKVDEAKFGLLVNQLGLEAQLGKYPSQLSGGQKQRVAIGRAIMNDAKILLMDEPFSSLDPITSEQLQKHLQQVFIEKKMTSVLVTHNIDEAVFWGDEIVVFDGNGSKISNIIKNDTKEKSPDAITDMKCLIKKLLIGD